MAVALIGPASAQVRPPSVIGLGQPLAPALIARYAITVFPDGRHLPPGQGSVAQGAALFQTHCTGCHGAKGIEGPAARLAGSDGFIGWTDPLRVLHIKKYPLLVQSVGARWPYAITAHLLHLNDVVDADAVMNRTTLPRVVMPAQAKTVSAWPGP